MDGEDFTLDTLNPSAGEFISCFHVFDEIQTLECSWDHRSTKISSNIWHFYVAIAMGVDLYCSCVALFLHSVLLGNNKMIPRDKNQDSETCGVLLKRLSKVCHSICVIFY